MRSLRKRRFFLGLGGLAVTRSDYAERLRPGGEIGLRDGFKYHCPKGRAGSSPAPGTTSPLSQPATAAASS